MLNKVSSTSETLLDRLKSPLQTSWVVITGAPSSGKSTLIRSLEDRGYCVCHDVAREVLETSAVFSDGFNEYEKQELIVKRLLAQYETFCKDDLIFFDYGMPDNLVFQAENGFQLSVAKKAADLIRYSAVFILQPLAVEHDGIRCLNESKQHSLYDKIIQTYIEFGYDPVIIPVENVQARLKRVLDNIGGNCETTKR